MYAYLNCNGVILFSAASQIPLRKLNMFSTTSWLTFRVIIKEIFLHFKSFNKAFNDLFVINIPKNHNFYSSGRNFVTF